MNAFILVQKGELTRFGQQEQEILGYLHQWTNGAFWKRLIILDRASFAYTSLVERSIKDKSYWFKSQTTDVEALKQVILDVAQKENWIIRVNGKETPLTYRGVFKIYSILFELMTYFFMQLKSF